MKVWWSHNDIGDLELKAVPARQTDRKKMRKLEAKEIRRSKHKAERRQRKAVRRA